LNFKKLVIIIPVVLLLILLFFNGVSPTHAKQTIAVKAEVPHKLIQSSDYNSPHSGKIETSIEIYSPVTEQQHELKKIQQVTLTSPVPCKSKLIREGELKLQCRSLPLIPFYISYCTIVV